MVEQFGPTLAAASVLAIVDGAVAVESEQKSSDAEALEAGVVSLRGATDKVANGVFDSALVTDELFSKVVVAPSVVVTDPEAELPSPGLHVETDPAADAELSSLDQAQTETGQVAGQQEDFDHAGEAPQAADCFPGETDSAVESIDAGRADVSQPDASPQSVTSPDNVDAELAAILGSANDEPEAEIQAEVVVAPSVVVTDPEAELPSPGFHVETDSVSDAELSSRDQAQTETGQAVGQQENLDHAGDAAQAADCFPGETDSAVESIEAGRADISQPDASPQSDTSPDNVDAELVALLGTARDEPEAEVQTEVVVAPSVVVTDPEASQPSHGFHVETDSVDEALQASESFPAETVIEAESTETAHADISEPDASESVAEEWGVSMRSDTGSTDTPHVDIAQPDNSPQSLEAELAALLVTEDDVIGAEPWGASMRSEDPVELGRDAAASSDLHRETDASAASNEIAVDEVDHVELPLDEFSVDAAPDVSPQSACDIDLGLDAEGDFADQQDDDFDDTDQIGVADQVLAVAPGGRPLVQAEVDAETALDTSGSTEMSVVEQSWVAGGDLATDLAVRETDTWPIQAASRPAGFFRRVISRIMRFVRSVPKRLARRKR